MKINEKDVERMAQLSGFDLSEEEKHALTEDIGAILDYVETLQDVDTEDVKPTELNELLRAVRAGKNQ